MNKEFFDALKLLEAEKGIQESLMLEKIENAIKTAVKKEFGNNENVEVKIEPEKVKFSVYLTKEVVENVENPSLEIALEDAFEFSKKAKIGTQIKVKIETKRFGRIAAQNAIQVIRQAIREAERGQLLQEFESRKNEIVSANVVRVDEKRGNVIVEIGRNETIMPKSEQIEGERLVPGDIIKVFVAEYMDKEKGIRYKISRKNAGLVKRLFEQEVPEIFDGIVEIKAVSREAGSRTKISVSSSDSNVDAVGACIGPKGRRVAAIVKELNGEKIDVVRFSEDSNKYISAALAPADVIQVDIIDDEAKLCRVAVDDTQLSLAIGNKGQNARLAARLTGWKIDIKSKKDFDDETDEVNRLKAEKAALALASITETENIEINPEEIEGIDDSIIKDIINDVENTEMIETSEINEINEINETDETDEIAQETSQKAQEIEN